MTRPHAIMTRYASLDRCRLESSASWDWLGADELSEYFRLRDANRRRQWLAGRWLSKQLLRQMAGMSDLADCQILSRNEQGQGVRPRVFRRGRELDRTLSISHSDRGVLVALAPDSTMSVGVDLTTSVPANAGFRRLWFAPSEQRWLANDPPRRARILWTIKEATYKAAHHGEAWNPREIEVVPDGLDRFDCIYRGRPLRRLALTLREIGDQLAAVACLPREATYKSRTQIAEIGARRRAQQTLTLFENHHD